MEEPLAGRERLVHHPLQALRQSEHSRMMLLGAGGGLVGGLAAVIFDLCSVWLGRLTLGTGMPSATS